MQNQKRTRLLTTIILCVVWILFASCNGILSHQMSGSEVTPREYQTEIEDYATFKVALLDIIINDYSSTFNDNLFVDLTYNYMSDGYEYLWNVYCDNIVDFESCMSKRWLKEPSEEGYKVTLSKVSNESKNQYCELASEVLEQYINTNIILSEYEEIPVSSDAKVWQFKELNTGIYFKFIFYLSDNKWEVNIDEEAMTQYLENGFANGS